MNIAYQSSSNKPKDIKSHNQKLVLSLFFENDYWSIPQISEEIQLSKTSVAKIISGMEKKEQIVSCGKGTSTSEGGKKPELFRLNSEYRYAIAINIDAEYLVGAITNFSCELICEPIYRNVMEATYEEVVQTIYEIVEMLLQTSQVSTEAICGITLGCDGIVDMDKGIICCSARKKTWAKNLEIRRDAIEKLKSLDLNCEVYVDNGCRYIGFADLLYRETRPYQCIATIYTTKEFVGGSIIQRGQLLKSANGFMGEFGHNIIEPKSKVKCECGNYGCLEALVSEKNLIHILNKKRGRYPNSIFNTSHLEENMDHIFTAARENDALARKVLSESANYFAISIHNMMMTFDPEMVIIQGEYARVGEGFQHEICKRVTELNVFGLNRIPHISLSKVRNMEDLLKGYANFSILNYIAQKEPYR